MGPRAVVAAASLGVLEVVLGVKDLTRADLWLDEAVAVHIAQRDPSGIVSASTQDTTPPLYYLVLALFERLAGISEAAVRWPSLLASGATAGALFLVARRWLGPLPAWCAATVFVLSDVNHRYAREARPYALVTLLCVLSFAALLRALHRTGWRPWLLVAVANALLVFTHYVAVFAVAAELAALLLAWRDLGAARRFALAHLPVAAALAAWVVPLFAVEAPLKMGWMRKPDLAEAAKLLAWFTGGHRNPTVFLALLALGGAALLLAWRRGAAVPWRFAATAALWAFLPAALAFAASHLGVRCFDARYLLYSTAGLALLWATCVAAMPSPGARLAAALAVCAMAGVGHGRNVRARGPEWRQAAAVVRAASVPHILLLPPWQVPAFAYYFDRAAFEDAPHTEARLAAEGVRPIHQQTDPSAIDLAPDILLVTAGDADPRAVERRLAAGGYRETERTALAGVTISRLARPAAPRSPAAGPKH